jgi:uncharacterized protein (DUF2147 family)
MLHLKKNLMAKRYPFLLFIAVLFSVGLQAQSLDTPTGRWQTLDDETGEAKSVINIYEQDGEYFGKIAKILIGDNNAVCDKCSGKDKGRPILGLVIIKDLKKDGDSWDSGTILDPQKGAEYKLSAWYENDNPDKLLIRGKHWTGLYRTQTWVRE